MAPAAPPPKAPSGKLGPLTPIQWAMVGGALGVVWWLWSRSRQPAAASTDLGVLPDSAIGSPTPIANIPGQGLGGGVGGIAAGYADNTSWYNAAVNALIASGYDPLAASSALSTYLAGGSVLSAVEQSLVTLALGRVGAPPNPPNTGVAIVPVPPPGTPPPAGGGSGGTVDPFMYLVKSGDTWESIARFFRGNPDQWPDIAGAANIHGPLTAFYPGQSGVQATAPVPGTRIVIPGAHAAAGHP